MEFGILGPLEAVHAGQALALGSAQQRAVLAILLARAPEPVARDWLIDELWGERPPATAEHAVQVYVSGIRKALRSAGDEAAVRSSGSGYVLDVDPERVDARRFERRVSEARGALAADPARAGRLFEGALALWRGAPLAEFEQSEFARGEGARLDELHTAAMEGRAEAMLACGEHAEVIGELTGLVAADPLRERPRRLLMLALYRGGRHAEALAAYRDACAALDELGLQPGPELRRLEEAILRHDEALVGVNAAAFAGADADPALVPDASARTDLPARADTAGARLPVGVVTLLFSDIEGSTRLARALGDRYEEVLGDHDRLLRRVWLEHLGVEVKTVGDSFFVAFADPDRALRAAVAAQTALGEHDWRDGHQLRVRIGVHTGSPRVRGRDYWGVDVNYAARLCAAAHGGQVLVSESTAALVDVELEDLGKHAVKDFPSARRIFHLPVDGRSSDCFPPPRTVGTGRTNLPDQVSSFVGRERELEELRGLLAGARVLTLTGAGGVGKTRLALRLGAELLDGSGDGVWFVDLAPLREPKLVDAAVAGVLGVAQRPGRPVLETLIEQFADRELLLVLDNCEHLIDATAAVAGGLVEHCRDMSVLATSREPLRIAGEQIYRVPSLSTPAEGVEDLGRLVASEAIALFVERATQQRPGFALTAENGSTIARVCRRLDGIPLAIELAVVRLRSLSVADLDTRLDQRFALLTGGSRTALPRQRTLLALIDWSYQLLSEAERAVLSRMSVFAASGFDLDAAETVCRPEGVDRFEVLDQLDALVDKSLVQAEDSSGAIRYRLLETVREYAAAKLAERGEQQASQARTAHRDHYLALAQTADPHLFGPDALAWLERLSVEHDNLRAALTVCRHDPDPEPGLRLATALTEFRRARGHSAEGARTLREQLKRPEASEPTLPRGYALDASSQLLANELGDYLAALAHGEEALRIARAEHDDRLAAQALGHVAWAHLRRGEHAQSLALSDEGLVLARSLRDTRLLTQLNTTRGVALGNLGQDARPAFEEGLDLARQIGDRHNTGGALSNIGVLDLTIGDLKSARSRFEEAIAIFRELGDLHVVAFISINLGFVSYLENDREGAARLFAEGLSSGRRFGDPEYVAVALLGLALASADTKTSAGLHGAADSVYEQLGYGLEPLESRLRETDHARLLKALGDDRFQSAYKTGHELPSAEAIALALASAS